MAEGRITGFGRGKGNCWVLVLGNAQDGGVPHLGCSCPNCSHARTSGQRRLAASLAIIGYDGDQLRRLVIDTGPDFRVQYEMLLASLVGARSPREGFTNMPKVDPNPLDAVLLTHLHMGHVAGLLELGREVANAQGVPLYCTEPVARILESNAPWSLLVRLGNIAINTIRPGQPFSPWPGLMVEALQIPHRNEFGDTVGYVVSYQGGKDLLYIPDADRWQGIDPVLPELVKRVDYALLDGTFFSSEELPGGKAVKEVPHPPVQETMKMVATAESRVFFTHLNHTNPLQDALSPQTDMLRRQGFNVAEQGQVFDLAR